MSDGPNGHTDVQREQEPFSGFADWSEPHSRATSRHPTEQSHFEAALLSPSPEAEAPPPAPTARSQTYLDDEEDDDGDDDFDYNFPTRGHTFSGPSFASARPSARPKDGGSLLDFIDDATDEIGSYLEYLENQGKGILFNRHDNTERARWREYLAEVCAKGNRRAQANEPPRRNSTRWPQGPPKGGAPGLTSAEAYGFWDSPNPAKSEQGSPGKRLSLNIDEMLGPCAPPADAVFEQAQGVAGPKTESDRKKLKFSACFESGNLAFAKSEGLGKEYTLLLDYDVNTCGYTQWFYFGVRGGSPGQKVTFKITNMSKARSLFEGGGMRPVVWSERSGRGWERGCENVGYYPNEHRRHRARGMAAGEGAANYRTLEFSYTFMYEDDTVFFAYHYPYTYSYLQDFLGALCSHPYASSFLKRSTLCWTIAGVPCEMLEIDDPAKAKNVPNGQTRPLAVVTARVHPGESNASWMMQGFLQFLCSPAPEAKALRQTCSWLVVPMLNPDGVIQGNYRCGLAGADLNRCFEKPHRRLHPTVWHLKERLRGRQVELYLDFHGHSRQEGIFFYGGRFDGPPHEERNSHVRLLPKLCALASSDFKYRCCSFSVQESKLTTARLVAFLRMGVTQAYTVEASFASAGQDTTEFSGGRDEIPASDDEGRLRSPRDYTVGVAPAQNGAQMGIVGGATSASQLADSADDTDAEPFARSENSHQLLSQTAGPSSQSAEALNHTDLSDERGKAALKQLLQPPQQFRRGVRQNSTCSCASSVCYSDNAEDHLKELREQLKKIAQEDDHDEVLTNDEDPPETNQAQPTLSQANSEASFRPSAASGAMSRQVSQEEREARDFVPSRLEMVGPTIGRALAACWQHTKDMTVNYAHAPQANVGLLDGSQDSGWTHLNYERMSLETAKAMHAQLQNPKDRFHGAEGDEHGSDSNPSGDEKNTDDLKKIHKRIIMRTKRRRPPLLDAKKQQQGNQNQNQDDDKNDEDSKHFRTIIAFGKKVKVPIGAVKAQQLGTSVSNSGNSSSGTSATRPPLTSTTKPRESLRPRSASVSNPPNTNESDGHSHWVMDAPRRQSIKPEAMETTPYGASDVRAFINVSSIKPRRPSTSNQPRRNVANNETSSPVTTGIAALANHVGPQIPPAASARLRRLMMQETVNSARDAVSGAAAAHSFRLPETNNGITNYRPGSALHSTRLKKEGPEEESPPAGLVFSPDAEQQQQQQQQRRPSTASVRAAGSKPASSAAAENANEGAGKASDVAKGPRILQLTPPWPEANFLGPQPTLMNVASLGPGAAGSSSSTPTPSASSRSGKQQLQKEPHQPQRPQAVQPKFLIQQQMQQLQHMPPRAAAAAAAAKAHLDVLQQRASPQPDPPDGGEDSADDERQQAPVAASEKSTASAEAALANSCKSNVSMEAALALASKASASTEAAGSQCGKATASTSASSAASGTGTCGSPAMPSVQPLFRPPKEHAFRPLSGGLRVNALGGGGVSPTTPLRGAASPQRGSITGDTLARGRPAANATKPLPAQRVTGAASPDIHGSRTTAADAVPTSGVGVGGSGAAPGTPGTPGRGGTLRVAFQQNPPGRGGTSATPLGGNPSRAAARQLLTPRIVR